MGRWLLAKLDQTVKIGEVWLVSFVLTYVPGIGWALDRIAHSAFPAITGQPASDFFGKLNEASPVLLLMGVLLRLGTILPAPLYVVVSYLLSVGAVFVGYQAMLSRDFAVQGGSPILFNWVFALGVDYMLMFLGLQIAKRSRQFDPQGLYGP